MIARTASLASLLTLGVFGLGFGCAGHRGSTHDGLAEDESALVDDNKESSETEDTLESGLEEPLSGAETADPGTPADPGAAGDAPLAVKTNAGRWFSPAGCITVTISGNTATSVFKDCTGPYGLRTYDGTVTSTWTRATGSFTVKHEAKGFHIDGATVDHTATIVYTRSGTVWTKTRDGASTGTTKALSPITHSAHYVTTYDAAARCITRDGSSSTTIGGRGVERSLVGYKRCGIGLLGCPQSGEYKVTRKATGLTLTLDFPGGARVIVTGPRGGKVELPLLCNPKAG